MLQTEYLQATPDVEIPPTPDIWESLRGLGFNDAMSKIASSLVDFSFRLLIAILVFYVGRYIIRKIYEVTGGVMNRRRVDKSLTTFVLSLVKMLLYFILVVTVIGILGIETSSFLALFASAGVAIGMALSGTLQNFAGGVLILLLKPYRVGDFIEAQGFSGTVKEIQIFHTVINTTDNKAIIIPNGGLSTGSINNYSLEDYRRVDWTVCLAYGDDYEKARQTVLEMLGQEEAVVKSNFAQDRLEREQRQRQVALAEEKAESEKETECRQDPDSEGCKEIDKEMEQEHKPWWRRIFSSHKIDLPKVDKRLLDQITVADKAQELMDRAPFVGLGALADSSINLTVRAWTHKQDYWPLFFKMNQRFYKELPEAGFHFPFPQMDVHLQHD